MGKQIDRQTDIKKDIQTDRQIYRQTERRVTTESCTAKRKGRSAFTSATGLAAACAITFPCSGFGFEAQASYHGVVHSEEERPVRLHYRIRHY